MNARRFEAFTDCPKCGHMDHHGLRAPLPKPKPGPARVVETGDYDDMVLAFMEQPRTFEVMRFDGMTGPDESQFEVIRTCTRCGHEWGQI